MFWTYAYIFTYYLSGVSSYQDEALPPTPDQLPPTPTQELPPPNQGKSQSRCTILLAANQDELFLF